MPELTAKNNTKITLIKRKKRYKNALKRHVPLNKKISFQHNLIEKTDDLRTAETREDMMITSCRH